MTRQVDDSIVGRPGLTNTEHVSRAAQLEIGLGNLEAIFRPPQGLKPLAGHVAKRRAVQQQAEGRLVTPADPSTQLVQLCQAKPFGPLDDHS